MPTKTAAGPWKVVVEARASDAYRALKNAFDEQHVPKEEVTFKVRRAPHRGAPRATVAYKKLVAKPNERRSLHFRHALKGIQPRLAELGNKKVKITIEGDDKSYGTRIEEGG